MSFQQGLSGLNAAAKNLDVIGNNVANSNTAGYKQSTASFGDVFAASLGGGSATQVGIGTQLQDVGQQFTQGNITVTNNPLDVAINGKGFFRVSDQGTISFSRNGQFKIDKDGYMVSSNGSHLTGFQAVGGSVVPGVLTDLRMSTSDLPPGSTTKVIVGANLSASDSVMPLASFLATDPSTYNFSTATSLIDSLGQSHTMTMYFSKTAANTWTVNNYVDGAAANGVGATVLTFDTSGKLATSSNLTKTAVLATGAANISIDVDFNAMTQFGSVFGVNTLDQDGFASGQLSGLSIGADGIILGRYSNGQSQKLGQIAMANFTNTAGLRPLGGSRWGETPSSGPALVGAPGSASLGSLQSAALEDANVDLTSELVNMITAQRTYQANAQSIKTQNEVMQTLVNLK